jgi:uncharacterized membrane protein YhaH (DUF805 family)
VNGRFVARVLGGYRQIGARIGFLGLLVILSAGLGALVALPLWLFATTSPRAYTAAVIAAAAAALAAAAARRIIRSGVTWPRARAKALSVLLVLAKAVLLLASLYATAAFAARRWYAPAAAAGLAFLAAAAWIGLGVRAGTPRKPPRTSR